MHKHDASPYVDPSCDHKVVLKQQKTKIQNTYTGNY